MDQEHATMLDELLELEDGLSDWEVEFIDRLSHQRDRSLTDGQASKLQQIWDERIAGS